LRLLQNHWLRRDSANLRWSCELPLERRCWAGELALSVLGWRSTLATHERADGGSGNGPAAAASACPAGGTVGPKACLRAGHRGQMSEVWEGYAHTNSFGRYRSHRRLHCFGEIACTRTQRATHWGAIQGGYTYVAGHGGEGPKPEARFLRHRGFRWLKSEQRHDEIDAPCPRPSDAKLTCIFCDLLTARFTLVEG
jgi:hypothetical protein